MMATDDERRRVAESLRRLSGLDYCKDPRYAVELASDAVGADHSNGYSWDKLLDRLADLIDPDCEDGRYEGVHTARPVDRWALLALADEFDAEYAERSREMGFPELADGGTAVSRRIREACGVVA